MAEEFRELAKRYFGIGDSESATLLEIAMRCARTYGVAGAATVGPWMAGPVRSPYRVWVPFLAGWLVRSPDLSGLHFRVRSLIVRT